MSAPFIVGRKAQLKLLEKLLQKVSPVLIYGPPGCSKTLSVKYMAFKLSVPLEIENAIVFSKDNNLIEKCDTEGILLIEDAERLEETVMTQTLEKLSRKKKLILEMRYPWKSRKYIHLFTKANSVYFPLPNSSERRALIEAELVDFLEQKEIIETLVEISEGFTFREIKEACQDTKTRAIREMLDSGTPPDPSSFKIDSNIALDIFNRIYPSVPRDMIKKYEEFFSNMI